MIGRNVHGRVGEFIDGPRVQINFNSKHLHVAIRPRCVLNVRGVFKIKNENF